MTATKYNFDAIDACRGAMSTQAGQYGSVGDGFQGGATSADVFGHLDASAGFASAIDGFSSAVHGELQAAEALLRKVESSLDSIETTLQDQEKANARGLTAT
ncbi:MAG TPA: hypothetical protein VGD48_24460 [Kutzneria sp.]